MTNYAEQIRESGKWKFTEDRLFFSKIVHSFDPLLLYTGS